MKVLLTLALLLCWLRLYAQEVPARRVFTDTTAHYQLSYLTSWQLQPSPTSTAASFVVGETPEQATALVRFHALPDKQKLLGSQLAYSQQDSVRLLVQHLPQVHMLYLRQHAAEGYQEVQYQYTYAAAPAPAPRTRVVGRRIWRRGVAFQLEYHATTTQDARYLAEGEQLLESFRFTDSTPARRLTASQPCNGKMYGIAALRYHNNNWEDDCRTIHEFSSANLSARPKVHSQVLPFQSYALAMGFDNCLYSVTKSPTNAPERVYRYNPATGKGEYTAWRLPAQGPENVWISAATDEQGHLYFMTSDASKLVKVNPTNGAVTVLWTTDPQRQAPFYPAIGFTGAGSHGNFCLDDARTLYQVYSTNGSLMTVNLTTQQPGPALIVPAGLPQRGGYSDLLFQKDARGRRWLYMAGPKALYRVDMERDKAELVRRGIYTDLAGCTVFRQEPGLQAARLLPAPSTSGRWRGRVLDATTFQPLPQTKLRLGPAGAETTVQLTSQGEFSFLVEPGRTVAAHLKLPGYIPLDSTYTTWSGPYMQDILLRRLTVGTVLGLENVQFEKGSARLLPTSDPALKKLLKLLTDTPSLTIELRGHTDNVGSPEKNVQLSEKRVAAVKAYLVRHGIAEARITGLGLGGTEPRASNEQEATRQLNRRVEFRVTRM